MDNLSFEQLQQRLKDLEKHNRLLQKKLDRSECNRVELENSYEIQSKLVNRVIQGLEQSRAEAETRNQELQEAFNNLQMIQTKLVESEKMSALGVLVAGIAHEINNPINFIHANIDYAYTYVQNLIDLLYLYQQIYPEPNDQIQALMQELDINFVVIDLFQLLNSMKTGSDRITNIVLGLRTFSRLDEAEYKQTNLHDGLDSTLMLLQHRLKAKSNCPPITVIKHYGNLPQIPCFAGQLNQVFMNILANAIDAIEERYSQQTPDENQNHPGCITISTSIVDSQWAKIAIADNGLGMPEQVRQKIFNPFFTTKPVGKGTGMGMAISYQIIIEKHRGRLDCLSKMAEGTEFVIQILLKQ
ncbi:sensor histidine kinase [Anabaena cylindrica FACHB-243]|uniref:histidine kinase n=1 Tax=Anabaena cylindrica (strain ATCC 27899 / PCC 7122) TaxID=272123 RepID=K9ZBV8_ANACC|nr:MULTISPECIES: ATP-binding protein [Anabaena]AFZ56671.1 histidine kinase [Anabaena cylindrica PCC 7122]MBD2416157.1 sensor histidine kinase [Anabaena cylindrica FACHB-243]MBY5282456.1 sensor histidine kinase [Anabaena sp. CCAP 1446/1C]MBY5309491.1 sensor histidine kinase [Anabaena sp. CCAP 1446/1C]MCM2408636.1 ATP-binding protein [Anabaena sp. CCAP 1446/1C]